MKLWKICTIEVPFGLVPDQRTCVIVQPAHSRQMPAHILSHMFLGQAGVEVLTSFAEDTSRVSERIRTRGMVCRSSPDPRVEICSRCNENLGVAGITFVVFSLFLLQCELCIVLILRQVSNKKFDDLCL